MDGAVMYDIAVTHGYVHSGNLLLFCVLLILWWELVKLALRG